MAHHKLNRKQFCLLTMLTFMAKLDNFIQAVIRIKSFLLIFSTWLASNRLIVRESKPDWCLLLLAITPDCQMFCKTAMYWNGSLISNISAWFWNELNFGLPIDQVCQKLRKLLEIICSVWNYLSTDALLSFYHLFAYSLFIRSITIWGGSRK